MNVQQASAKAAATVSEVAVLCQLSRSRFYELVKAGIFPEPVQNPSAKRPIYVRERMEKCLEIRRTGVGMNGQIIVFNRKRTSPTVLRRMNRGSVSAEPKESCYGPLIAGLKSLGMLDVTEGRVAGIVADRFPDGLEGHDLGEAIRAVFLELKKKPG